MSNSKEFTYFPLGKSNDPRCLLKMHSTINDLPNIYITCSCGCKTYNLKKHIKSNRHKYMQQKHERLTTISTGNNDNIILNHFLKYDSIKKKIQQPRKPKPIQYLNISCFIDFD